MKTELKNISLILAASLLCITVLLWIYKHNQSKNYDFKRKIEYAINKIERFQLKYNSYYIAGITNDHIILGNYTAPLHALKISCNLRDTQSIELEVDRRHIEPKGTYKLLVVDSQFYLYNGFAKSILQGSLKNWKASKTTLFTPFFSQFVPLTPYSSAFKYVSSTTNCNALRKESITAASIKNDEVLQKQVDGLFCTEGTLISSGQSNLLIYTYYYRNEVTVMDTNLNVIRKFKTIDPIDSANFKITKLSDQSLTFSTPPLLVNAKTAINGPYLFVQSKIMSRSEDEILLKKSAVIDVYNVLTGTYLSSIYLPLTNNQQPHQIFSFDNYVITLSGECLTKYTLKPLK